jgi:hypothetical protein
MTSVRKRLASPVWQMTPWDLAELIASVTLVILLNLIAVFAYRFPMLESRVRFTEALNVSSWQKVCVQEAWALSGEFPPSERCKLPDSAWKMAVREVPTPVDGPAFVYRLNHQERGSRQLGIWLSAGVGPTPATLAWHCGPSPMPAGMRALAPDLTTLEPTELPGSCRGRN